VVVVFEWTCGEDERLRAFFPCVGVLGDEGIDIGAEVGNPATGLIDTGVRRSGGRGFTVVGGDASLFIGETEGKATSGTRVGDEVEMGNSFRASSFEGEPLKWLRRGERGPLGDVELAEALSPTLGDVGIFISCVVGKAGGVEGMGAIGDDAKGEELEGILPGFD